MTWFTVMVYLCHNDHQYIPLIERTSWSFTHTRLSIGYNYINTTGATNESGSTDPSGAP